MRAIVLREIGGPGNLHVEEVEAPVPVDRVVKLPAPLELRMREALPLTVGQKPARAWSTSAFA